MYEKLAYGLPVALAFAFAATCSAAENPPLEVRAVSERPSLVFTESEALKIRARVEGGEGSALVEYSVKETCGDWTGSGRISIPRSGSGAVEAEMPLTLPGRGHFKLELTARCGETEAKSATAAAVVYDPLPASDDSPWGIMYGGYGAAKGFTKEELPAQIAESMRLLGASWTRLNLWSHMYKVKIEGGELVLDMSYYKQRVAEFRKRGINVMGEFVMTPQALSSMPDAKETTGDAGPLFCRVKPADYKLWDQMVEKIAREFKNDIPVWEIWNEVDIPKGYWAGTKEEFLELMEHTTAAIRRGSPSAKIAAPGFTSTLGNCKPFFDAGFGKNIDILSVHYTDAKDVAGGFQKELDEHGLKLPIWNSEELSIVPLNNLSRGIRSFKFIHMIVGYPQYIPLLRPDWQITPAAVSYSVGARLIGSKKFKRSKEFPGFKAYFFGDDGELAAISASGKGKSAKLFESIDRIAVKCAPRDGAAVAGIDALGREKALPGGCGEIPFGLSAAAFSSAQGEIFAAPDCAFVSGCKDIDSVEAIIAKSKDAIVVEAESGDYDKETVKVTEDGAFSGGKYLNIYCANPPGEKGYGADLKLMIEREADYRVFFSGNSLSRIPVSLSSFEWSFDGGAATRVDKSVKTEFGGVAGAPEGLAELGKVHLKPGEHVFRLRLTAPRSQPDSHWALWFDAIALIPVEN